MTSPLSSLLLLAALACAALAQEPSPSPSDQAAPAKRTGCLRVWMFPGSQKAGDLSIATTAPDGSVLNLASGTAPTTAPFYRDLPAGKYCLDLKDGEKVLAQKELQIAAASYQTAIAWWQGGKWNVESYSDSAAPGASAQRPLRFLNFAGEASTTVAIAGFSAPIKLQGDSIKEVKLPPKNAVLDISSVLPGGGAASRNTAEVDLTVAPAAYVLVAPDYRGRLRPQFLEAGAPVQATP